MGAIFGPKPCQLRAQIWNPMFWSLHFMVLQCAEVVRSDILWALARWCPGGMESSKRSGSFAELATAWWCHDNVLNLLKLLFQHWLTNCDSQSWAMQILWPLEETGLEGGQHPDATDNSNPGVLTHLDDILLNSSIIPNPLDPWCCYIWCTMDPINIPHLCEH